MRLVAVSAGESPGSKTRALAVAALDLHGSGELIDLHKLSAEGLLGRIEDVDVANAVAQVMATDILVVATPIYRATYTAACKGFFDRFPYGGLSTVTVVLIATAGAPEHFLAIDTGLRPMIASLSGLCVPTVVYATSSDFHDGAPSDEIRATLRGALAEAARVASARPPTASA